MTARYEWLAKKIDAEGYERGAEIGVYFGRTFRHVLENSGIKTLYGVDVWENFVPQGKTASGERCFCDYCNEMRRDRQSMDIAEMGRTVEEYAEKTDGRGVIMRGESTQIASEFADGWLDFVFIDGDHSYEGVKADIEAWRPKVRSGGMIAGHDINMKSVRDAVSEVLGEHGTEDDHVWWAVK